MKKLFCYFREYRKEGILAPLFKLLEASFELLIPLVVAGIVDRGIGRGDVSYILRMVLVMVGLGALGLACSVTAQYFAARAAVGFAARLRHAGMAQLLKLSYADIDRLGSSAMMTRMTSDINQVQNGVNLTLRLLLRSPFVVFGAVIMSFTVDVQAALAVAGVLPLLCLVVFGIMLITMPMYRKVQTRLDGLTSAARENLSGVRVLRAFRRESEECRQFQAKNAQLSRSQILAGRISALMNPITYVLINLGVILLLKTGAWKVDAGLLTQGQVIALYNYISQILVELIKLANLIISITKAAACARRVQAMLEIQPSQQDGVQILKTCAGQIEFDDVTAGYADAAEPALEHISFSAQPGQTIGILGGTGSGKSTLVNLIPRFYDLRSGRILIDGQDISRLNLRSLREKIGVVPQNPVLFRGTVRENLLWGNEQADDSQLWQALKTAQADDVVSNMDSGLDSQITQQGKNLSGGQRQRLTIARALVRHPGILILDDSASALDYATDARLRTAIRSQENPPTTLIVSQRAASVRFADRILVLDDGRIAGSGTHSQLLKTCETYREIYYSQFPKEAEVYENSI